MERLKFLFQQTMMISFGIIAGLSIQGIVSHSVEDAFVLQWYHPASIIVTGILCSLPSLLLGGGKEHSRKSFHIRIALHFVFLFAVVMSMGYIFRWYSTIEGAIWIVCDYVIIYVFVWLVSGWLGIINQKEINNALEKIRDEE